MTRAKRNLAGLTTNFDDLDVHRNYLNGLKKEEFRDGMHALARTLKSLYTGMASDPQAYAMKGDDDIKGLAKNTNFLLLLAEKGVMRGGSLEIDGRALAPALKDAKVTKPEIYFRILEPLGFATTGLGKKIETSENITVEFLDHRHLLAVLKAMADAVGMFALSNPNQGNHYFELLDHRVLANHPATEPETTMEHILSKLKTESRDAVAPLYAFIEPLAKCDIKGSLQWYWTPTFTLRSTKKVIMSFKLTLGNHEVKLNLANIGKYTELLDALPARMVDEIKDGGWGCGGCNPKCAGAFAFELGGKPYRKCRGGSFVFVEPSKKDSELLLKLLKKELEIA